MTILPSESPLTAIRNNRDRIAHLRAELKAEITRRNVNIRNADDDGFSPDALVEAAGVSHGQISHILAVPSDENGQTRLV